MEGRKTKAELRALDAAKRRASNRTARDATKARAKLKRQGREAATVAKYGRRGRPAPVTVRSLATGEEVATVRQFAVAHPVEARKPEGSPVDRRARQAGYGSYAAFLASPYWRELRGRVVERDGRCVECGSLDRLQAHHRTYARLGRERLGDLVTLCRACHRTAHRR